MEEARQAGVTALPDLGDFVSTAIAGTSQAALTVTAVLESMVGVTSRRERGLRVLRMLCEARGASEGHLYLCRGGRHRALVHRSGSDAPPDGLSAFLECCIRLEREQAESATAIVTAEQLDAEVPVTSWTDPVGRVHLPLVLTCMVDGAGSAGRYRELRQRRQSCSGARSTAQLSSRLAACLIERRRREGGDRSRLRRRMSRGGSAIRARRC